MSRQLSSAVCCAMLLASCLRAEDGRILLNRVDANVYRGPQPGKEDIPRLSAAGIKTVLDLRGALGHRTAERAQVEAAGMRYVRIGLSGFFAPSDQQIDRILQILDDPGSSPVFVHCRRGADRSGLVIACYRITHYHWTNEQAMHEAREHGFSGFEVLMQRYIRHYRAVGRTSESASPQRNIESAR